MLFMSWVVFSRMKSAREERARALGTSRRRSTLEVPDDIMPSLPPSYWTQRMTFWWRRTVFTNKSARGSVSSVPGLQAGDASDDGSSFAHSPSAAGGGALYPPLSTSVRDKEKPGSASPGGLTLSAYRSGGSSAGSVTHSSHWHFTPERHMPAVREEGEEGRELESSLPSSVRGELNQSRGYVKEVNAYDLDSLRSPAPDSHRSHVG
uniref:Uncharacterized protein n=1 Tax=Chromera velia CCMP2878 TaxID=1169474 RepID=A0A0G4HWC1_9ALVE|eukprot:Cvel_32611.t1-p1 / transcript=Cvel_32611.t1 / gene=Cvel_32611 / organism=Chromera_velia_CCMP2878 / gene_product=hypothetical protein / transcript_product=hypothetical protein / location=Cvel_scaffold5113:2873-3966(+) / protein_length=206 / sequence_SO=supercontig / SO=protein_coding / is_pseudo=false